MNLRFNNQMRQDLSIREIAEKAGVSIATVSRVINNPEQVSQSMLDLVLPIIEKYDYVPNLNARNVFSRRSNAIAIFVYDMRNPFFLEIIRNLNILALENDYMLLICDTENDQDREREYYRYCRGARVAGIVLTEGVFSTSSSDAIFGHSEGFSKHNIKLVSIDRPAGKNIPVITSDNVKAGYDITNYLISLNHRRIAFAGYNKQLQSINERFKGFQTALQDNNLQFPKEHLFAFSQLSKEAGAEAFDALFKTSKFNPTAVVCANDEIARGLINRANGKGFTVPEHISITGFDGVDNSFSWSPITTMKQQIKVMTEQVFNYIVDDQYIPMSRLEMIFTPGETTMAI